jgi:hypothetical protein
MVPTQFDARHPGGLVAVLYGAGGDPLGAVGRVLEVVGLDAEDVDSADSAATRHAVACSEGGGVAALYDGDTGLLRAIFSPITGGVAVPPGAAFVVVPT